MAADRVVSWIRRSLGKSNIYVPSQLFDKVNVIMNVYAFDVSKCKLVKGFQGNLSKYFKMMPDGYTKYYYFELADGKVAYKFHAETPVSECIIFKFCTNVHATRNALLRELFGELPIEDVIKNKNVLLPNFDHVLLPDTKIQSLGNKYSTIQAKWLWYYPNLDGTENEAVERDNEDPADA